MITIKDITKNNFQHIPTPCQENAISLFEEFIENKTKIDVLIIKGYAGTGKTSLIKAFADTLDLLNKNFVLLSPTGRGAKVITEITKHDAFTIHKHIYNVDMKANGQICFKLNYNTNKNTIFIIDEASMISATNDNSNSNYELISEQSTLNDLFTYIMNENGNKILIIGDPAQLPPVNFNESPALNSEYLENKYNVNVKELTLTEIMRQDKDSGILFNANEVRNKIEDEILKWPTLNYNNYSDFTKTQPVDIFDVINNAFSSNSDESLIITVSNKIANKYNNFIRSRILNKENIIDGGDIVMCVKNNYFWQYAENSDFIANGEMMQIKSVRNIEFKYNLNFADVTVKLLHKKNEPELDLKIILDTLNSNSPALPYEQYIDLINLVVLETGRKKTKKLMKELITSNVYLNALQIKFAWALTCHKAQGGQWDKVIIDTEFLLRRSAEISSLRWLYTAITRAKKQIFITNSSSD